ncbi:MAG: hypothetical protein C7B46_07410 [Sulfobacillus benefaciens]|uniref:Class II aldolase/adducin N-terminal domain-containing protein n=1 Tax=Sulfobacillus benefaciens TaxID=453960 RepID=A0A2T2XHI2_9FIRM|nr:MAG: hypothetical protein C7B46_07410 [Sulfobacillus benefaciens]
MRNQLVEISRRFAADNISPGTSGNISVRDPQGRTFWITPSGMDFSQLMETDLVEIDVASGNIISGDRIPSSEVPLHVLTYQRRPDVQGIVHTHSLFATMFSTLNRPIKAVHYQLARVGDEVPLADYATYGTQELADRATNALGLGNAVLLKNHGLLAVGESLGDAYRNALDVEWVAHLYFLGLQIGEPDVLTHEELERIRAQFKDYGQKP